VRVCPTCGRVLDERPWTVCPRCREPIPPPGEELPPAGMLTTFGVAMTGLVAGGMMGIGLAATLEMGWPLATRLALWPAGLGLLTAAAVAWLSVRLMRPARRSFERLMIACMGATFVLAPLTLLVWPNVYFLGGSVVAGTLLLYSWLRELPADWGLEGYSSQGPGDER